MNILLSVICSLLTVVIGTTLVGKFYNFFVKSRGILLILALLFGIVVYAIGYWSADYVINIGSVATVGLQSLFSSARFFIFDSDYSLLVNELVTGKMWYAFLFSLSGIFTMFVTATTVLSAFGMSAIMQLKLMVSFSKKVYILLGIDNQSVGLACDIRKANKKALIVMIDSIAKDKQGELFKVANSNKIILLKRDLNNINAQRKFYLNKLTYHRIFHTNVQLSVVITDCAGSGNAGVVMNLLAEHKPTTPVQLHCVTEVDAVRQAISATECSNWDIRIDSYADLVADSVISNYPIIDYLDIDNVSCNITCTPKILIGGSSKVAEKLAYALVKNSQFNGFVPNVTICGDQSDRLEAKMSADCPELKNAANITYHNCNIGSTSFYDIVASSKFNYHLICDNSSELNLEVAEIVRKLTACDTSGVFAYAESAEYIKFKQAGTYCGVTIIGCRKDIFSYGNIIEGQLDRTAIGVNMHYNGENNYYSRPYSDRTSSKSFGLNIPTKLKMLGMELCAQDDALVITAKQFAIKLAPHIDSFARQEHLRWNAFHYATGWTQWSLADIPQSQTTTKDNARKLHSCLVTFDELDAVSERFADKVKNVPQGYKGYDILLIEAIPKILEHCGLAIRMIKQ